MDIECWPRGTACQGVGGEGALLWFKQIRGGTAQSEADWPNPGVHSQAAVEQG